MAKEFRSGGHDKTTGYGSQQQRRNRKRDNRSDDSNLDERLADGFEMLSEDDNEDVSPAARAMMNFDGDDDELAN